MASAAGQPDVIETRFKQLDTNGDGKLSAEEVKAAPAALQQRLKGADKDGDGVLTLAEVQAHFGQPAAKPKPAPSPKADPVREAPKVLAPNAAGIGRMVPDVSLARLSPESRTSLHLDSSLPEWVLIC